MNKNITLSSIDEVKKFVGYTSKYPFDIFLVTDKYKIDAKSIMGVFSLDLSRPVKVEVESKDPQTEEFFKELQEFAAGDE